MVSPAALAALRAAPRPVRSREQDEESLLRTIGSPILSGIAMGANLLDVPGSMARDVIGGTLTGNWGKYNPFDQLLTPLSHENRVYGRGILSDLGVMRPNKPTGITGWLDDPMEAVRDIGGFAFDVATDPFVVAAGPTKSAIHYGLVNPLTRGIGSAVARTAPGAAAVSLGKKAGRLGRQLFDASVMGRSTEVGQQTARELFAKRHASTQRSLAETLPEAQALEKAGMAGEDAARVQRDILEGVAPWDDPTGSLGRVRAAEDAASRRLDDLGAGRGELEDVIDFAARRMGQSVKQAFHRPRGSGRAGPLSAKDPSAVARMDVWRGFRRGTNHVNEVLKDSEWGDLIRAANTPAKATDAVAERLAEKYGNEILPTFQKTDKRGRLVFTSPSGGQVALSRPKAANLQRIPGSNALFHPEHGAIVPSQIDRYRELAKIIVRNPELREHGLFTNHWLVDAYESVRGKHQQADALEVGYDLLARDDIAIGTKSLSRESGQPAETTIGRMLGWMGVKDRGRALEHIAARKGLTLAEDAAERTGQLKALRDTVIDPEIAADIRGLWPKWQAPKEVGTLLKLWDSQTGLFKAGVLTWPARYVRDITSGMVRNWENGMFDFRSGIDSHALLQGRTVEGLQDIPAVRQWLERTGREMTDEAASDAFREMFASFKATTAFQNTDMAARLGPRGGGLEEFLFQVSGRTPGFSPRRLARTVAGREPGTSYNPLDVRGVMRSTGEVRGETTFGPALAGDMVGRYTDDMNRMVPFLNQLRKGHDPAEAMARIMQAQVDYSPRTFTKFEQGLKRIFPFYSFSTRQIPYLTKQLLSNPGGRLGILLRAQRTAQEQDRPLPEYVAQTGGIPLGEQDEGTRRYLTGLGLMHEDPMAFLGGGLPGFGAEVLSRSNPMLKLPVEMAAGESFFQRGPMGGRELSDMDPALGRLLTNVGLREPGPHGRARPVMGTGFEHLLANSPLSRAITTARTLTDPRKRVGDYIPGPTAITNVLSGLRVSDLSPAAQEAMMRETAGAIAQDELGGRSFEVQYIPQETIERLRETDPERARRAEAYNALRNLLARRARQRASE